MYKYIATISFMVLIFGAFTWTVHTKHKNWRSGYSQYDDDDYYKRRTRYRKFRYDDDDYYKRKSRYRKFKYDDDDYYKKYYKPRRKYRTYSYGPVRFKWPSGYKPRYKDDLRKLRARERRLRQKGIAIPYGILNNPILADDDDFRQNVQWPSSY